MKIFLKPIFDFFTNQITVLDNPILEFIIKLIIGSIAFSAAWRFVNKLYNNSIISSKNAGSFIHWTVRAIVFYVACVATSVIIAAINWCRTHWIIIALLVIIVTTIIMFCYKANGRRKENE